MRTAYDATLQQGVIDDDLLGFRVDMTILHPVDAVVDGNIHTPHHALVITEEEDGEASDTVDGDEELSLLVPVNNVMLGNEIHL